MKKDFLILLLVVIVIAIVLTIALLFSSRAVPEKQNPAIAKSVQTQIAERENFLEKIGASTDADITSSLERKNPLDVFEAIKRQTTETKMEGVSSPISPPSSSPATSSAYTSVAYNPNLENLDGFLLAVEGVGRSQGYSEEKLALAKQAIIDGVATTTNLREKFISDMLKNQKQSNRGGENVLPKKGFFEEFVDGFRKLVETFVPTVNAQVGLPFGGRIYYTFLCTCSGNWLIQLVPLPPTDVVLLTYYMGTQAYLSYNTPITEWLLGSYLPGASNCLVYAVVGCFTMPSQGTIGKNLGSSPL